MRIVQSVCGVFWQFDLAREMEHMRTRTLPDGWDADIKEFPADPKGEATRDSGGKVMNAIAPHVPWLIGGAAAWPVPCRCRPVS